MTRPWEKTGEEKNIYTVYQEGGITKEELWEAYADNLRSVLEEVDLLRNNIDAEKLILTADHGNSMRWPIYGHPMNIPLPVLRRVPWVETTATDHRTHQPREWKGGTKEDSKVEDKLRSLGYLSN